MRRAAPVPADLELNGLPGPSHAYAGLSFGNLASQAHRDATSNPRAAALQVLDLAEQMDALGVPQGWLPPPERPHLPLLDALGYDVRDASALADTLRSLPEALLATVWSASSMWTANAATVAPACDTADGRTRFLVANLVDRAHRAIEGPTTRAALIEAFPRADRFEVMGPLPPHRLYGDEGAANHTRLVSATTGGVAHLFVYGAEAEEARSGHTRTRFPARQSRLASHHAALRLGLCAGVDRVLWPQSARAIDAGVFHNDVICVGHGHTLLVHEDAFEDLDGLLARLRQTVPDLAPVVVSRSDLSLQDAVSSYLFNARLVTTADGRNVLVCPEDCRRVEAAARVADGLAEAGRVDEVRYVELRESMQNGGGPACLRLRVPLSQDDRAAMRPASRLDAGRIERLRVVVRANWRESLRPDALREVEMVREHAAAIEALRTVE
jgi:succinylarginine dihydrolase